MDRVWRRADRHPVCIATRHRAVARATICETTEPDRNGCGSCLFRERRQGACVMMPPATALTVEQVAVRFGGLVALSDVNFTVGESEIVSLIGPNGAGKTTAFNVVTGFLNPTHGAVSYRGT